MSNGNFNNNNNACTCCCKPIAEKHYFQVEENNRSPEKDYNVCVGDYERHMYEQTEPISGIGPKEPYHIPGYAGHVPTLQHHSGGTYGDDTHAILMSRGEERNVGRGGDIHTCPSVPHEPYHLPGYTGHVPGLRYLVGGNYGQDTHRLMYSAPSYLTRQENLSPYRPPTRNTLGDEVGTEQWGDAANSHALRSPRQSQEIDNGYRRPDQHYYQPQFKYRLADTYATTTENTLVDPCVNEESRVLVSTRELDDTQVVRSPNGLIERIEEFPHILQPVRHRPMVPGFDTYIDALRGARGQRFEFNDHTPSYRRLQQQLILPRGRVIEPSRSEQQPVEYYEFQQPRQLSEAEGVPFGYSRYGGPTNYTNSVLYDFTSNYRRRLSTEWAPANISRPDPPAYHVPGQIYSQHDGLLPGYSAHVPGALYRCGRTFTDDSRDARRALRGDRY